MDLAKGKELLGDFDGKADSGIEFRFRFCNNGAYYFLAERKGFWRHAHNGRFWLRSEKNPRPGYPDRRFVTLEPLKHDLVPPEKEAFAMLSQRALPTAGIQEYVLTVWEFPHGMCPDRKVRSFSFSKPDRTGYHSTNWDIQPMNP
jgi:hypothetical protein